ncbi:hypothetical protein DPMN_077447 [Dreissena polymorpha]|uniref:Uncharacterized protein n=1 Tax=Dreissena polymorpha TaxID=45954 RepID=A0A9D3YNJ8_DREPO|nr:hypothetical protein DPMN_077447 [Dreissena polymorpha]
METRVQDSEGSSNTFPVTNRVKQGCALAQILFSIMFSAMLTNAPSETRMLMSI